MNLNITLISELVVFAVFLFIVKKRIWPAFIDILDKRQEEIEQGLICAQQSKEVLAQAEKKVAVLLQEARDKSSNIIEAAQSRAASIEKEANEAAQSTLKQAEKNAEAEIARAKQKFLQEAKEHYAEVITSALNQIKSRPENKQLSDELVQILRGESA